MRFAYTADCHPIGISQKQAVGQLVAQPLHTALYPKRQRSSAFGRIGSEQTAQCCHRLSRLSGMRHFQQQRFVETPPNIIAFAPMYEEGALLIFQYYIYKMARGDGGALAFHGQLRNGIPFPRLASVSHRANITLRRGGRTLQGTEVHDGLIVERRALPVEQERGQFCKLTLARRSVNGGLHAKTSRKHAIDIAIYYGARLIEAERGYRRSGVWPNAFQPSPSCCVSGKTSSLHDLLRRGMKIPGAAVIAQTFPLPHHAVLTGCRQMLHRGECREKAMVIVAPLLHARLLQDDFAHPYGIRVANGAPGQIAGILRKPLLQQLVKLHSQKVTGTT